ncbi:MAG: hypothetical protein V4611_00565 [Patescibacteria group bacterium]
MESLKYKDLADSIKNVFLNSSISFDKKITKYSNEQNDYIADQIWFNAAEEVDGKPPIVYSVVTPWDSVSNTAPQHAIVFQGGEVIANKDFTHFADQRTAIMGSITLNYVALEQKNILIYGCGKIARCSVAALSELHQVDSITYTNRRGHSSDEFEEYCSSVGVNASFSSAPELSKYNVVLLHTDASSPIFTKEMSSSLSTPAIVASFKTEELDSELTVANDTQFQIRNLDSELEKLNAKNSISLQRLFSASEDLKQDLIVYSSGGSTQQNVAVLKLLI